MKKMKKIFVLSLLTLLSLTSCGNNLNSYSKKINKSIKNAPTFSNPSQGIFY